MRLRNCCLSLRFSEDTNSELKEELKPVKAENDSLTLTNVAIENVKQTNHYLERT